MMASVGLDKMVWIWDGLSFGQQDRLIMATIDVRRSSP